MSANLVLPMAPALTPETLEIRATRKRQILWRMGGLALLALICAGFYMVLGARGSWSFVLSFRGTKLIGLVLVAIAVAISTVVFQTLTRNRILTPSIMGFDSLYVLLQTMMIFFLGSGQVIGINPQLMFLGEVGLLLVFAGLLYRWLFAATASSLHLLLMVGIVFGTLFRSIAGLLQRVMDPAEFLVLQDRLFASFNTINQGLLWLTLGIVVAVCVALWRMLSVLDVLVLGRESAISLGVDQGRITGLALGLVILLVAVSTALVGPVAFFGLLVANLAYLIMPSGRHAVLLPAAALLAIIALVGGQTILERVFGYATVLSVIIEFIGGIVFILLVIRRRTQ